MQTKYIALLCITGILALGVGSVFFFLDRVSLIAPQTGISSGVGAQQSLPPARTDAPLYFTTMTHMEEDWEDDTIKPLFTKHVAQIRAAMDLFDTFGAKLTIESAEPFASANVKWGVNVMEEVVDRGHGVGTHAGFHVDDDSFTPETYAAGFAKAKAAVDVLVGEEHNQGVSGGFAYDGWVDAAAKGGFKYLDGLTALGYLSMPMENRPQGFTDAYIRNVVYHDSIPPSFADRLYMYDLKDSTDLVPDDDGVLTIMGGEIGELRSIAEGRSTCNPDCIFDQADIDAVVKNIQEADAIRDRSKVARINVHIPLELLTKEGEPLMRKFLEALKPFADDGTIIFATQLDAYKAYKAFNETDSSVAKTTTSAVTSVPGSSANTYFVTNPSTGSKLYVAVTYPKASMGDTSLRPLVFVPGSTESSDSFSAARQRDPQQMADEGFAVYVFDPEGRGKSEGVEDDNGFLGQDGLDAVIRFASEQQSGQQVGLFSFSYGVTMATGALARHTDIPVAFLVDWEGPMDRNDTGGCDASDTGHLKDKGCTNEAFWSEREAINFIDQLTVPYLRIQSQKDHAQPDILSAVRMVNAAIAGTSPWVRLNNGIVGATYSESLPPQMLSDMFDRTMMPGLATYAKELYAL
ncbi:MAG: CocE/NonD family hydrolase [Patescibacteria group bacterium]